jgi:hypothetical protein
MRKVFLYSIAIVLAILLTLSACTSTTNDYWTSEFFQEIYLFGQKISLPGTINEWGEDFTLYKEVFVPKSDTNDLIARLLYKNEAIGTVTLRNCSTNDANKIKKSIVDLSLGSRVNDISDWYKGVIQLDFLGISFDSTPEEVEEILGVPTIIEESFDNYFYDYQKYIVYEFSENEHLELLFRDGKIVEIDFILIMEGS